MPRVLVIEKDGVIRSLIEGQVNNNLSLELATTVHGGFEAHRSELFDLVIWDTVSVPSECPSVVKVIKKVSKTLAETKTIVISNIKEPEIISLRNLRCEWLHQPLDERELLGLIESSARYIPKGLEDQDRSGNLLIPIEFEGILAFSLTMRSVIQHIIEAAAEDIPVLITGETGTGKDLVAAAIHKRSKTQKLFLFACQHGCDRL